MVKVILGARTGETGLSEPAFVKSPLFKGQRVDNFPARSSLGRRVLNLFTDCQR
ncbi:hypothetical protein BDZ91DRAFT_744158 [Kalaharituber pfeilii]|nr:hypothetical protein BDZ91DRAFT_744158 [Kalaharituber pfeilii]